MKVTIGDKIIEHTSKDLTLYIFNANYDPIYKCEEAELTTIKIPALNENHAWNRLERLLGSKSKVNHFRLDDWHSYE